MQVTLSHHESPVGRLIAATSSEGLHVLSFGESIASVKAQVPAATDFTEADDPALATVLRAYFKGELDAIDGLRVVAHGTAFQRSVWDALRKIPVGSTVSYGALAMHLGKPAAVRAVGRANARNPIALVVPCHRVIAATGKLHGYAGGLWRKQWLLTHEKAVLV